MIVIEEHIVPDTISKVRLVDYAYKVLTNIPSRTSLKKAIKRGEILIDGQKAEGGNWVIPAQKIVLLDLQTNLPKIFELPIKIVYEDDNLAIIHKPAGISVSGNKFKTVVNALPFNLKNSNQDDALKIPKPVHRLDYATSGLLLVAKTSKALVALGHQFEQKKIKKRYRAIVVGKMKGSGVIDHPINEQNAVTTFQLISHTRSLHTAWLSLVDLFPITGRTHQLRIHMSGLGYPILGDKMYDKSDRVLQKKGLFLSAVELSFDHPIIDQRINISVEMPQKFTRLLSGQERRWNKYS